MAPKLTAFLGTLLINVVVGVAVFLFLLLAMNGYSESDATYGLGVYIVLALLISLFMSAGAFFAVGILKRRGFRSTVAVLIVIPLLSVISAGLQIVSSIIGVLTAEFVRVHY
ncbi:MAG TPA: hypothetical protein VMZ26_09720 [Pyrinomonadaceae bacterium]|nr:hypothetical protein [Pyrinomonadaceae bacterium]